MAAGPLTRKVARARRTDASIATHLQTQDASPMNHRLSIIAAAAMMAVAPGMLAGEDVSALRGPRPQPRRKPGAPHTGAREIARRQRQAARSKA